MAKKIKNGNFSVSGSREENLPDKLLLVMAGTSCNNHCVFCSAFSMLKNYDRSMEEIAAELHSHKNKYANVEFTGGEFTIREDAVALVKLAKRLGYTSISLETNGKMFVYRDFSEKIIKAGINHISFSIHGARASTHDFLTNSPGSFSEVMAGLKNACRFNIDIVVNYVVAKQNYKEIPRFAKIIENMKKVRSLCFSFIRPPEYFSKEDFLSVVPRFSDILPFLKKASRYKKVSFRSIPPCLIDINRMDDREKLTINKNYGNLSGSETCYVSIKNMMAQSGKCGTCRLKAACLGTYKKYLKYYGEDELKPIIKKQFPNRG